MGLPNFAAISNEPLGLAIALGVRHAEVPRDLLARVPALLVADDHDRAALEAGEASHDGGVVSEQTVAVQFDEVVEHQLGPVARVRPLGMARQLRALPGGQAGVRPLAQPAEPLFESRDLVPRAERVVLTLQRRDAGLDLEQRLLEIKRVRHAR